jgi:hypothetical protein
MFKRFLVLLGRRSREYLDHDLRQAPTPSMQQKLERLDERRRVRSSRQAGSARNLD